MDSGEHTLSKKRLEELFEAGCTTQEAAGFFGYKLEDFVNICQSKYNINVSEYSSILFNRGKAILREKQYKKALTKGDNPLLIWLGKARLGQKDKIVGDTEAPADIQQFFSDLRAYADEEGELESDADSGFQ